MARYTKLIPTEKVVGNNANNFVVSWSASEIESAGLIALNFILTSLAATPFNMSTVQLITIKANSKTQIEITPQELISYQEKHSPRGATDQLTDLEFTMPMNKLGAENWDLEDKIQFMVGATITVELRFTTGATQNGTVKVQAITTDVEPEGYLTLVRQPVGLAGQINKQRVQLSSAGEVFTFGIVSDQKLRELTLDLSGRELFTVSGPNYNGNANQGNGLVAMQKLYDGVDAATRNASFTFVELKHGLSAVLVNSALELTTGPTWTVNDGYVVGALIWYAPRGA